MSGFDECSVVSFAVDKIVHNSSLKHLVGDNMSSIMADIETAVAYALRNRWGIGNNALNLSFSIRQVANEDIPKIEAAMLIANPELRTAASKDGDK